MSVTPAQALRLWQERIRTATGPSLEAVPRTSITVDGVLVPDPATFCEPRFVLEFASQARSRTTVADVQGAAEPPASIKTASPRTGQVSYLFTSLEELERAERIHRRGGTVQLIATDIPGRVLWYLPQGDLEIRRQVDSRSQTRYTLTTAWAERLVDLPRLVTNEQPLDRTTRIEVTP